jgi:hypothetical protein
MYGGGASAFASNTSAPGKGKAPPAKAAPVKGKPVVESGEELDAAQ